MYELRIVFVFRLAIEEEKDFARLIGSAHMAGIDDLLQIGLRFLLDLSHHWLLHQEVVVTAENCVLHLPVTDDGNIFLVQAFILLNFLESCNLLGYNAILIVDFLVQFNRMIVLTIEFIIVTII